jgi:hypothetical protein
MESKTTSAMNVLIAINSFKLMQLYLQRERTQSSYELLIDLLFRMAGAL